MKSIKNEDHLEMNESRKPVPEKGIVANSNFAVVCVATNKSINSLSLSLSLIVCCSISCWIRVTGHSRISIHLYLSLALY